MADSRRPIANRLPGAVAIGVAVAVAVYAISFAIAPSVRRRLAVEDGIIETTTAVVFLAAAIVGVIGMRRSLAHRAHWLIPLAGLLGFLDEMRFGARAFDITLPSVSGIEIDNLHAMLLVADHRASALGLSHGRIALLAGVAALGAIGFLLRGRKLQRIPHWLAGHCPVSLMLGALALLAAGFGFDQLGSTPALLFAEESCEFAASGLVLVAATCLLAEAGTGTEPVAPTTRQSGPAGGW